MLLPDGNVLISSFRPAQPRHAEFQAWLETLINGQQAYGMSDLVLSGFLRIVTNVRAFRELDTMEKAMAFASRFRPRSQALGHLQRPLRPCRGEGESGAGCLSCRPGHRERLRMDHHGSGLRQVSRTALAPPFGRVMAA